MATPNKKNKGKVTTATNNTTTSAPVNTGQLPTTLNLFVIPTKNQVLTGTASFIINGKAQNFAVNKAHNICLNSLAVLGNTITAIKQLFITLYNNYTLPATMQYSIKGQYGIAFGITAKQGTYKAIVTHHKANGANSIIVNQCNAFTFASAVSLANKHGIALLQGKGGRANWGVCNVTTANMGNMVSFVAALLNLVPVTGKPPIAVPAPLAVPKA